MTKLSPNSTSQVSEDSRQYQGSEVDYYKVSVPDPANLPNAYRAECIDIIEALGMTFAEGNAFKAIWRKAAARQNLAKKGYTDGLYDSEKAQYFGGRMVAEELRKRSST